MADATTGRLNPCSNSRPGIEAGYIIPFVGRSGFTIEDNGDVSAIDDTSIQEAFKYELVADENIFTENKAETGRSTGTTVFDQSAIWKLKKKDSATRNELNVILKCRHHVVMKDNEGNWCLLGLEDGSRGTMESTTGGARSDSPAYTITWQGQEFDMANYLTASAIKELETIVSQESIEPGESIPAPDPV